MMAAPKNPDEFQSLMSYKDVARALGVHKNTIRSLVAKGEIPPPMTISSKIIRFNANDIRSYMEGEWRKKETT